MSLADTLFAIIWFLIFLIPVFLAVWVIFDALRSDDLSGWARGGWIVLVLILPLLGALIYVIARGHKHHERANRQTAVGTSDELAKLAKLRDDGVITDDEFGAMKARLIA